MKSLHSSLNCPHLHHQTYPRTNAQNQIVMSACQPTHFFKFALVKFRGTHRLRRSQPKKVSLINKPGQDPMVLQKCTSAIPQCSMTASNKAIFGKMYPGGSRKSPVNEQCILQRSQCRVSIIQSNGQRTPQFGVSAHNTKTAYK